MIANEQESSEALTIALQRGDLFKGKAVWVAARKGGRGARHVIWLGMRG